MIGDYFRCLIPVRIVNFDRSRTEFVDDKGAHHRKVMRATPAVLQAWKDIQDLDRRRAERKEQFDAEEAEIKAKITEAAAAAYAKTGKI